MTNARRTAVSVTLAITVAVVTGCSSGNGGADSDPTTKPSSASPVPKIAKPLDVSAYLKKPCDLVDKSHVTQVGPLGSPKADVNSEEAKKMTGPKCDWIGSGDSGGGLGVAIQTTVTTQAAPGLKGMNGLYQGYKSGLTDYYRPVTIPGHPEYPAAFVGHNTDKTTGDCYLYFGVRDDLDISVNAGSGAHADYDKSCQAAQAAAKSALDKLTSQ